MPFETPAAHASPRVPSRATGPTADLGAAGSDTPALWDIDDVATFLGVTKQTIYSWRTTGYGPAGFRVGKHLRWRRATVIGWTVSLEERRQR